jgi:hypothetical protein
MTTYQFVVMTSPVEGRESEYNLWYNEQHLGDVLKVPGVVSAQRFELCEGGTANQRYLALYEIETPSVETVMAEINRRAGTEEMPVSDAMDMTRTTTQLFKAITEHKTSA